MAINDRLMKKMWHIYTWNTMNCRKIMRSQVFYRIIDGAGGHYLWQAKAGREKQTLHVLTDKGELIDENS